MSNAISSFNTPPHASEPTHTGAHTLTCDSTDLQLLAQLQTDASLSNAALAAKLGLSPATALRRVKRLVDAGMVERQVAILNTDAVRRIAGAGISAIVEVSLDQQGAEHLDAFEAMVCAHAGVQQCYRTSPGPDFCLVVQAADMPAYLTMAQTLFTAHANVRNVKAFFSLKRAKFSTAVALPAAV
ncbi:MAG: Lrp/AsnC family transcriptional regulator [Burkholderiaceae bacterium]|nr:Lrp/AsnC family transcriptional regulator [Burkholderiaceae bacterium]